MEQVAQIIITVVFVFGIVFLISIPFLRGG